MLMYLCCLVLCFQLAIAQSSRGLDSLLQDYAFRAFPKRPVTGTVYDGEVPANLTGIRVAALRLRSGSLRRRGVARYKEFQIPIGVVGHPYVERIVLVYQNLGNWSEIYYPLAGYTYLAPVLGLLAYDGSNLSATGLSELDVQASEDPISVRFSNVQLGPRGSGRPMCVYFGLNDSVGFNNVVGGSTCLATSQGHFSIAVESLVAPAPAPAPAPTGGGGGGGGGTRETGGGGGQRSRRLWITVGSVVGGAALLVFLVLLLAYVRKCLYRKKIRRMEDAAESGVPLPMARVGQTKAPVASETRTKPVLENELVA